MRHWANCSNRSRCRVSFFTDMRFAPNRILLALVAVVLIPALTLSVRSGDGMLSLLTVALLVGLAGFDLWQSRSRLDGLQLATNSLVRGTVGRELELALRFMNEGRDISSFVAGLEMASEFSAPEGPLIKSIGLLTRGNGQRLVLTVVPLRRGQYEIEACHVETASNWRLWVVRRRMLTKIEVRVYPDLSAERRKLSALFLHRGNDGVHAMRQVGKGREFEQLRDYLPGDDYGDIDWKATSRRGLPVTRTFQIERTQEVYVIADHSRLSAREIRVPIESSEGSPEFWNSDLGEANGNGGDSVITTQLEAFLKCSLVLASVAQQQSDLFGFVGFADRVDHFVRSGGGSSHYNIIRDSLYTIEPAPVAPDFEELMVTLRQRLTRRALLIMLVDLSDPLTAESFYQTVPMIARQHLVLVNMVRPPNAHPVFSADDQPEHSDDIYRSLAGHLQWRELREIGRKLGHLGVELALPNYAELSVEAVTQYLNVKRRQVL